MGVDVESFFDPATDGDAVSGTTTLGTINWENGAVTATLDRDITGKALDFLALDGSVKLTLKATDGTKNGNTWTWAQSSAPWSDGDKLMVRLYTATASACAETDFGACVSVLTFSLESYAFSVSESAAVGNAVGTVSAVSPTAGATVTYSLTAGNEAGKFTLDTTTGLITVASALDYETASSYSLAVEASDGTNTATAAVAIAVTDANDPPVFDPDSYSFSVSESTQPWTIIGQVTATDEDEGDTLGGTVFYYITAGNDAGQFMIDGAWGYILVRKALDYETTSAYTLTVEVRDGKAGGVDTATVAISVTDVAE